VKAAALALAGVLAGAAPAVAQAPLSGYASAFTDVIGHPDPDGPETRADVELRARVFLDGRKDLGEHVRIRAAGYIDGLLADRHQPSTPTLDAVSRPRELYAELVSERLDVRFGYTRIVWGRLDELQPTDVVNPLDLARFFFEGRSEARLAVPLGRVRLFLPASTTLEAIVAPQFTRSQFDQLDEPTSAFNLAGTFPIDRLEPAVAWSNVQGGARLETTTGRVDWGVSGYRGFESFGVVTPAADAASLVERFPRFTMIGGDFETVRGEWGIRGEVAAFVDDTFQSATTLHVVEGQSFEGGVGADRKAGTFRVSGNVLVRRRLVDDGNGSAAAADLDRSDVNLIASIDRAFARATRKLQLFAVYDPTEATSFLRGIVTVSVTDHLSIEASGGWFAGSGPDTLGRFTERDFMYLKVKRAF
jgi:hypothetical protein